MVSTTDWDTARREWLSLWSERVEIMIESVKRKEREQMSWNHDRKWCVLCLEALSITQWVAIEPVGLKQDSWLVNDWWVHRSSWWHCRFQSISTACSRLRTSQGVPLKHLGASQPTRIDRKSPGANFPHTGLGTSAQSRMGEVWSKPFCSACRRL